MTVWYAFDPGKSTGVAWAYDGALRGAFVRQTDLGLLPTTKRIVELPQWRGPRTPSPVRDLIGLACKAGQLGGPLAEYVTPTEWKGTEKKEDMHHRLRNILTPDELSIIDTIDCPKSLKHNVLDAVCLLMWRLGRLETRGSKKHGKE